MRESPDGPFLCLSMLDGFGFVFSAIQNVYPSSLVCNSELMTVFFLAINQFSISIKMFCTSPLRISPLSIGKNLVSRRRVPMVFGQRIFFGFKNKSLKFF